MARWARSLSPVLVLSLAVSLAAGAEKSSLPLLAGVVQVNGILFPFAEYKNGAWQGTWLTGELAEGPKVFSLAEIPQKWTGYPPARLSSWYLSSADSHNAPLKMSRALIVPMHCGELWGLETNLPKQMVPLDTYPIDKAGVAFTVPQNFSGMKRLTADSPMAGKLSAFIRAIFDPLNQEAGKANADIAVSSATELKMALRSEPSTNQKRWTYVEVERSYTKKAEAPDNTCPRTSFMTGWVEEAPSGVLRLLQKHFYATDCDMKEVNTETPFGILALEGRLFIFSQANGYESETYTISTLDPDGIHPHYAGSGGGC